LDEAHLMGIVLEKGAALHTAVGEVMEGPFPVVSADESLDYVSRLLGRGHSALLVRDDTELTGILTRFDIIHSMAG
jgi:cystathionine beta-synthase